STRGPRDRHRGAALALLSRGVPASRRRADHLRDGGGEGARGRDGPEARAGRDGPARAVGAAAPGLGGGEARRRDLARVPDEPRAHDRGGHGGDLEDDGRDARARTSHGEKQLIDFRPSPYQQILIATAREYLRHHCPLELAQQLALDASGETAGKADKLWRGMAELGWPGLLIPSELGGSDGTLLDVILLVEEMGRAGLPGPFVTSAVVATSLVIAAGSPAQQKRLLSELAAGTRIASLALVEETGSFDLEAVALECLVPGRLSGRKLFVKDAHVTDDLVVAVRVGGAPSLVVLPTDHPGIARLPLDAISGEKLFEVTFDHVEVR